MNNNAFYVVINTTLQQLVWDYRLGMWQHRDESVWIGRRYTSLRAARRTAARVGGHVACNKQYIVTP